MTALLGERTAHRRRFWIGWSLALALTGSVVVLATLPPFVGPELRTLLMHGFSTACHQIPDRSPHLDGVQLAVCHRCYGIYWGLPLAVVGFLALRRWDDVLGSHARYVVFGSMLPPGIDWLGGVFGLWVNTPLSRLLTGGVFGLAAGYYVARALVAMMRPEATSPERPGAGEHQLAPESGL